MTSPSTTELLTAEILKLKAELRSARAETDRIAASQKRMEESLHKAESYIKLLLKHTPLAIAKCDREGHYLYANDLFSACYGVSSEAVEGKQISEFIGQEEWASIQPYVNRVLAGETVEIDHTLFIAGLGERRLYCTLVPDTASHNASRGWFIFANDITARKKAEQEVYTQNERLRILSESLAHLLSARDPEEIVNTLFPKVAKHIEAEIFTNFLLPEGSSNLILHTHYGLNPEMVAALHTLPVGASLCGLVAEQRTPLIVSDIQNADDCRSEPLRVKGFQAYVGVPLLIADRLLGTLGFASQKKKRFTEGELEFIQLIAGYAAVAMDRARSELHLAESEHRFRTLADTAPVMIWMTDVQGRTTYLNSLMKKFYGSALGDFMGRSLKPDVHPDDYSSYLKFKVPSLLPTETEFRQRRADGLYRWTTMHGVPRFHSTGSFIGSIGVMIDITERKQTEEKIREMNVKLESRVKMRTAELNDANNVLREEIATRKQLEEEILEISEREQRRIGQDLHDDLGQQLAGTAMLAKVLHRQLVIECPAAEEKASDLAKLLSASVGTARNLAKGLYPVELERGDLIMALEDLADRTERLFNVSCILRHIQSFRFDPAAAIHIYRIVQESMNNAIKHAEATSILIECAADGEKSVVSVENDGIPFQKRASESGGMGLHLMRYRARIIGAEIDIKAASRNTGCIVRCTFGTNGTGR